MKTSRTATFPAVRPSPARSGLLKRLIVVGAVVLPVVYALIANLGALDEPPAWDSAVTVSPAALTIVELDFDIWEVAQLPSSPEGGPSTHATSLYTIGLAFLILVFGPSGGLYIAHLLSIALVSALAGATYLLARERASVVISGSVAATVAILPLVTQQAADVYIDLPLAVITTFACWTTVRRRFWWTAGLVFLAVAIKTSGVFLLPLLLLAKPPGKTLKRHLAYVTLAGAVAIVPFAVVLATTHRFSGSPPLLADPTLIRSSMALLVLTIDVFAILSLYFLVTYGRARSDALDRTSQTSLVLVLGFFAVHIGTILLSGTIAILPRYYIAVLPAILAALVPAEQQSESPSRRQTAGTALLGLLALFSLLNLRGDFYPRPDDDFYVIAERSTRAQELLELQVLGTQELAATGLPVLAERQVHFRLEYPGMGYVSEPPEEIVSVFVGYPSELPDRFAMLMERRYTNPLVEIEEAALLAGYTLDYRNLSVGPYESQLVIASSEG